MAKTIDLNHLYDDEGLYSALVARGSGEYQLASAISYGLAVRPRAGHVLLR